MHACYPWLRQTLTMIWKLDLAHCSSVPWNFSRNWKRLKASKKLLNLLRTGERTRISPSQSPQAKRAMKRAIKRAEKFTDLYQSTCSSLCPHSGPYASDISAWTGIASPCYLPSLRVSQASNSPYTPPYVMMVSYSSSLHSKVWSIHCVSITSWCPGILHEFS